ncbi:hypothetical protein C1645_836147 [Glomus cerebriforme]|uniref:Myb-like domain-containing protein n=1 Tax=Glomus cerebriforme TaxID=658196 RepID=A0A397S7K7_9GLOM|nr:hypothetical protein C1645_836147 [Glomus cerebriforme]
MGKSKVQTKGLRFTPEADEIISECMLKWGHLPGCYAKISRKVLPQYKSKRIRQRWTTILNPKLNRKSLSEEEKLFIDEWVENNRTESGKIQWTKLADEIERIFDEKRSDNMLKNYWNAEQRKLSKSSKVNEDNENEDESVSSSEDVNMNQSSPEITESTPMNEFPYEVINEPTRLDTLSSVAAKQPKIESFDTLCFAAAVRYKQDFPQHA